ncbi:hypothetical protein ACFV0H_41320 [Streptomyces erythrochromogenes]|uniref:IclR family transcriptional regulator domain-containing protein n=1 Tax=Streptomyces erythrochromogenes TaxID=285574 RepID=UPI003680BE1C
MEVGESAHLCVLRSEQALIVQTFSSKKGWRPDDLEGTPLSLQSSLAGHVLVSDWNEDLIGTLFSRDDDIHAALTALRQVKRSGYAISEGGFQGNAIGISSPVRDFQSRIVAALVVYLPVTHITEKLHAAGRLTLRSAVQLSRALGYSGAIIDGRILVAGEHKHPGA